MDPNGRRSIRRTYPLLGSILSVLLLIACSGITVISDYDEETDKSLTSLQQKTDDFVERLEGVTGTSDGAFEKNKDFYDDADRDLRQLEFRVNSIPKNGDTVELVSDIRKVLLGEGKCNSEGTSLKDLHCSPSGMQSGPSKDALVIAQRTVNQTISAALNLEIAKKQGLERNK